MGRRQEADEKFEKLLRALGYAVLRLQKANGESGPDAVRVTDVRFKLDADSRTSVLVILKGVVDGSGVVAFAGGPNLETAVLAVGGKLAGGGLKWREDRPWTPRGQ